MLPGVTRVRVVQEGDIWFPARRNGGGRAERFWSAAARENPIDAAAATPSRDPFAKYPEWIREHFQGVEGVVLDGGCGYGRVSIPLLQANPHLRCVGVDVSPVMLDYFVELARERGLAGRVALYCGHIDRLPFDGGFFRVVLSSAVLHHLPTATAKAALREFYRVLEPGGKLVLNGTFPNMLNPEGLQQAPFRLFRKRNGLVRSYTRREVSRLLSAYRKLEIQSHHLILLPRSLAGRSLPGVPFIRRANQLFSRRFLPFFQRSGLLVSYHEVVAVK